MKPLALSLLATTLSVSATPPKVESVKPQDGIYVTYGMHSIVLELKKDRFRYWFSSDVLPLKGEEVEYPLEGSFIADRDKIVLQYERFIPLESNWTFKAIDGVVTMWRSDAIKHLTEKDGKVDLFVSGKENFFRTGGGSILVPTDKTAEEAWRSPQYAVLPEEEHRALIEKKEAGQTAFARQNATPKFCGGKVVRSVDRDKAPRTECTTPTSSQSPIRLFSNNQTIVPGGGLVVKPTSLLI